MNFLKNLWMPRLTDQTGSAAIITSLAISGAIAAGVFVVSDKMEQVRDFEKKLDLSAQLSSYNVDSIEAAAQLMQSQALGVNTDAATFDPDSVALKPKSEGGLGWDYVSASNRNEIRQTFCNPEAASGNVQDLLVSSKISLTCDDKKKVTSKIKVVGIQIIDTILADGSKEQNSFAVLEVNTSMKVKNETIEKRKKARIKVPPPGTGDCPFTDPNQNPPKVTTAFDAPFYVAVGRAFVGWTRIGIPVNRARANGYASVQFEGELTKDLQCGRHVCNYWAPSSSTEDIRAWKVKLGGLLFGVQLHTPKTAPGSCYLTFHPNRRPRSSWNNGCFASGTMIRMSDMSLKPVEKISEGDQIYNPVTRSSEIVKRTIAGPETDPLLRVTTDDSSVVVTRKHPFQTASGLIAASELRSGDRILGFGGRLVSITEIQSLANEEPAFVYNFALESSSNSDLAHMVEADGVVTGDLFLQEKVSGVDPTKRPTHQSVSKYKNFITELMLKK